jgi:hypothetical protein
MARSIDIFVASDLPLEEFVKEAEHLLKLQFQRVQDEYELWYETIIPQGRMAISTHEFENDRDMKFEEFKFSITFWANRGLDEELTEQIKQEIGQQVFEAFKQTGKFAVMLVYDLQRKLDEFRPLNGSVGTG